MRAQPQRIVVGFDGSAGSRRALEAASQLMGFGSELTVVTVAPDGENGGREMLARARDFLLARLVTATYVHRHGEAAAEIVVAADELSADLIIVGRRARRDVAGQEPGSEIGRAHV